MRSLGGRARNRKGRRQHEPSQAGWRGGSLRRGGSGSTVTRTRRATGEALLVPPRNRRSKVGPITGDPGKWAEDDRVAEGSAGAKGPCCSALAPTTRKAGAR